MKEPNALVPLLFEFRTTKVQWTHAHARIKGWWKGPHGIRDHENLIAEVPKDGRTIPFPLERVPDKEWQQCVPKQTEDGNLTLTSDADVEKICSAFRPQLLISSERTYNIKITEPIKPSQPADAWDLRDEFFRLKLNPEEAVQFLNKWGSWNFREHVLLAEIEDLQRALHAALISPPEWWFANVYSALPRWRSSPKAPYFTILTDKCEIALRMTVTIDLLHKRKFKTCARGDCDMPFRIESGHSRVYCRPYCSHLESMRRNRKTKTMKAREA
jgi:hypothetical protein